MKTNSLLAALLVSLTLAARAQDVQPSSVTASALSVDDAKGETPVYEITERDAHSRVWARVNYQTNKLGDVTASTNSYTELATGMHYRKDDKWLESEAKIEIMPNNAGAAASKGQHKAIFPLEIKSGIIELQTPDNQWLRSRIWGLAYFDGTTGESLLLAEVKESEGQLVGDNTVIYPDAFSDGLLADIRYTYSLYGFEQDVVIRSQLPDPEKLGMNRKSTRLQVLTEFLEAPVPAKESRQAGGLADQSLGFGQMSIGSGKAFSVDAEGDNTGEVPVAKEWIRIGEEGRDFLIEEVHYEKVAEQLEKLPASGEYKGASLQRRGAGENVIAGLKKIMLKRYVQAAPKPGAKRMAQVAPRFSPGFVMDYLTLLTQPNVTLKADTTYYVTNSVNLTGTTTLEGGTVVKFASGISPRINIIGTVDCRTSMYRPAVFTAKDDNTVGEAFGTGAPGTTKYGSGLTFSTSGTALNYLRFSYANTAISLYFSSGQVSMTNIQFMNCLYPINFDGNSEDTVTAYNSLFYAMTALTSSGYDNYLRGCHLTVNGCQTLFTIGNGNHNGEVHLTNSILANVSALGDADIYNGSHNGFFNSPTFGISIIPAPPLGANPFQPTGAASHYLADGSYRDQGTTDVPPSLLANLKLRTTQNPTVIAANMTGTVVWTPNALRDTDGQPDLGYHYDPLDYVINAKMSSANLTLAGGVVLGTYGAANSYGLGLTSGSFVSEGMPAQMNWIVRYNTVQEQSTTTWSANTTLVAAGVKKLSSSPTVKARFTGWSVLGGNAEHFNDTTDDPDAAEFTHSQFSGGKFTVDPSSIALTNCLWERVYVTVKSDADNVPWYLFNNLFYGGTLYYRGRGDSDLTLAFDNLFDKTTITRGSGGVSDYFTHGKNGYVGGIVHLQGASSGGDIDISWPADYQDGPLGKYYYNTAGNLNVLINADSARTPASVGLYHFTVKNNGTKEGTDLPPSLDIGFHYVAAGASGAASATPADTDGDTVADYFEDTNGDGDYDPGEDNSNWLVADTRLVKNTTQIANPCLECSNCEANPPPTILPQARPHNDPNLPQSQNCDPLPWGAWPQPLPTSSSASGATLQLDNYYKVTSPPLNVNLPTEPRGFKNTYAIKLWQGRWGFRSPVDDLATSMGPDCDCITHAPQPVPNTTKYLTMSATATAHGEDEGASGTATKSRTVTVNSRSGRKVLLSCTDSLAPPSYVSGRINNLVMDGLAKANGWSGGSLQSTYCAKLNFLGNLGYSFSFSGGGTSMQAVTTDANQTYTVSVDLDAGSYSCTKYYTHGDGTREIFERESLLVSETLYREDFFRVWDDFPKPTGGGYTLTVIATLSNPYTSDNVNADCDALLARWNLLDDAEYPWRTDGGITRGPLVTFNEKGGGPEVTMPCTIFNDLNWPGRYDVPPAPMPPNWEEEHQLPWIEEGYTNGQPRNPSINLPWPSQPPGTILGAPLTVHSPNGALYTNDLYFNFYHINWTFRETERGHPQGFIASHGAFSPFPNATQWVDDDQARVWPAGPFWAYGSAVEAEGDHFLFRLKNPYITDTEDNFEQGGYGAFLIKCKWAETIDDPAPAGKDFVFKDWKFNFRDFIGNYYWNANAWYRNEIDIPGREKYNAENDPNDPDIPVCGSLLYADPTVRYSEIRTDPPDPFPGYFIGLGSYWISEMNCAPQHYDPTCRPAIFVQPNSPGPGCSGLFVQMPPAVCDEHFGSLWMGRVDQSTSDANACANYVANRNNGIANPPSCDPQIELDLVLHYNQYGNPSAYELFVAPLGFTPGGVTPRLDLDIDSDNNNGFSVPSRTEIEDLIEDDPARPGKYVWLNEDDWDADDIPDFADGFNLNGTPGDADDLIESADGEMKHFAKLVLELPPGTDMTHASLNLGYSASAPATVTSAGDPPEWTPGPGKLRIWRRDASEPRNGNSARAAANPGDYVEPGVYTDLSQLGLSAGQHTVTYFVEGIAPIASLGHPDFRINVSLDPDGGGPVTPLDDSVRVTVIPKPEIIPDTEADVSADDHLIHVVCELGESGGNVGGVSTDGSELEWGIAYKSANESGGWLSETTTQFADGLTATTLNTSTLPGTAYRLAARLRNYAGVNLGDYGPWAYSAVIVVVPGKPHSIALTPSKFSYHSDGTDTTRIEAQIWDQYGNAVADDTPVVWGVDQNPAPPFVSAQNSTVGGKAVAVLRAPIVPENQTVTCQAGDVQANTTITVQRVTGSINGNLNLDIGNHESATATIYVDAADGTPVYWTTSNGEITPESVVNGGVASATLSAARGRLGTVVVTATIGDRLLYLEDEFTSSAGLALGADHPVLIGEASSDGVRTRTFDHGITRQIPYYAASPVRLKGPANALVQLTIEGAAPVASWAFDTATGNVTPSNVGVHDMTLSGAVLDAEITMAGASSLRFEGAGTGTVADDSELDFTVQFNASVWIRPGQHGAATIAAKAGAWEISQLADGRVQASVTTANGTFTTATTSALPLNQWTELQVDFRFDRLQVFLNNSLATQAPTTGSLVLNDNPILVGPGFIGHLDTLTLRSGMNLDPFITTSGLGPGNTVQLDANGTGSFTIASRGTATSAFTIRIRGQTNPEGETQVAVVPHDWWDYTCDGVKSFIGGDPETISGTVTSIAGGVLVVGDVGSVVKNLWRMARGSDVPVNRIELILGGIGSATTLIEWTGVGTGVDVALAACKTLAIRWGETGVKFLAVAVSDIWNVVTKWQKLPEGKLSFLQKAVSDAPVGDVFRRIAGDELIQNVVARTTSKLGNHAESFYQGVLRAATAHGDDVAKRMVQSFDGLGDDVLDALKNTPTAQLDEAMDGLAAVLKNGVDPGVIKNALNAGGNFGTQYKQANLLIDLKLLDNVPGLDHCLAMMKNATTKGFRYEIEGAAALKRQGMQIVEMGRRAANRVGRTDIDVVVRDGTDLVYYQFKRSTEALGYGKSGLKKTKAWVWKALKDLGLRGEQVSFAKVRYAVPPGTSIPPRIQHWLGSRVPPVRIDQITHLD